MRSVATLLAVVLAAVAGCAAPAEIESAFPRLGEDGYGTLDNPIPMAVEIRPPEQVLVDDSDSPDLDEAVLDGERAWVPLVDPEGTLVLTVDPSLMATPSPAAAGFVGVAVGIAELFIVTGAVTIAVSIFVRDPRNAEAAAESVRRFVVLMKGEAIAVPRARALTADEVERARATLCQGKRVGVFALLGLEEGPARNLAVCDGFSRDRVKDGLHVAPSLLPRSRVIQSLQIWNLAPPPVLAYVNGAVTRLMPGLTTVPFVPRGEPMLVFISSLTAEEHPVVLLP